MMKNVLIVFTVLAMASVANATLSLSFNGRIDLPDSEITLKPSQTAVIDVHSQNEIAKWTNLVVVQGLASADLTGMSIIPDPDIEELIMDVSADPDFRAFVIGYGYLDPVAIAYSEFVHVSGTPKNIPDGVLIDGILLHCEGQPGDVIVTLLDGADGTRLDQMVIHQIPEPITLSLLGLGGLFLRRRK
jgi:hypothetical protein